MGTVKSTERVARETMVLPLPKATATLPLLMFAGANIAGFEKVVDAMLAQGVC